MITKEGGQPHTFAEVKNFGGGFIEGLNDNQPTIPECADGFKNIEVAKTHITQGSTVRVTGLSKGEHHFQCCSSTACVYRRRVLTKDETDVQLRWFENSVAGDLILPADPNYNDARTCLMR